MKTMQWHGLTINIEKPVGTVAEGVDEAGQAWRKEWKNAYGEIRGTKGVDGDPVDVFLGPEPESTRVFIVRQMKRNQWDQYDEDKCMINFPSQSSAKAAYLAHYDPRFLGSIVAMPVEEFIKKVKATAKNPAMIKSLVIFVRPVVTR
jgi:hypothetical protein